MMDICDDERVMVSEDRKRVWVNGDDGSAVGRFSKTAGMDVHTTATEQMNGAGECLHCTHEKPGLPEWELFCDLILKHYGITVDKSLLSF